MVVSSWFGRRCAIGILPVLLVEVLFLEAIPENRPCVFIYRDGSELDATRLLERCA